MSRVRFVEKTGKQSWTCYQDCLNFTRFLFLTNQFYLLPTRFSVWMAVIFRVACSVWCVACDVCTRNCLVLKRETPVHKCSSVVHIKWTQIVYHTYCPYSTSHRSSTCSNNWIISASWSCLAPSPHQLVQCSVFGYRFSGPLNGILCSLMKSVHNSELQWSRYNHVLHVVAVYCFTCAVGCYYHERKCLLWPLAVHFVLSVPATLCSPEYVSTCSLYSYTIINRTRAHQYLRC